MSASSKTWDVAGTGSMVVDEIHLAKRILGADEKSLLRADERGNVVQRMVGGVVLNHLGWARVLGLRTAIFGKQGDDPNGRYLRAGMERLGIAHRIDQSGSVPGRSRARATSSAWWNSRPTFTPFPRATASRRASAASQR